MNEVETQENEANLCVCEALKIVMVGASYKWLNPQKLFYQLEYILQSEHGIKNYMDYKVRLLDADTEMSVLKEGLWK